MPARISLPLRGGGNPGFPGHQKLPLMECYGQILYCSFNKHPIPVQKEPLLTTCGCTSRAVRLNASALAGSVVSRLWWGSESVRVCKFHGGRSTGPRTSEGLQRCAGAVLTLTTDPSGPLRTLYWTSAVVCHCG